jgi:hypothetical protein
MEDQFLLWMESSDAELNRFWTNWIANHPDRQSELDGAIQIYRALRVKESSISPGMVEQEWLDLRNRMSARKELNPTVLGRSTEYVRKNPLRIGIATFTLFLISTSLFLLKCHAYPPYVGEIAEPIAQKHNGGGGASSPLVYTKKKPNDAPNCLPNRNNIQQFP